MKKKILLSPLIIIVLIVLFGVGVAGAAIYFGDNGTGTINLQKGLVGWWKMDGNARDSTVNSNNGTLAGNTALTTDRKGQSNKAYTFDGTGDYIDLGGADNIDTITGDLTLATWVNITVAQDTTVISTHDGKNDNTRPYDIFIGSGTQPGIRLGNGAAQFAAQSSSGAMSTGAWHHLAGTVSGTAMTFYLDGVQVGTDTFSGTRQAGSKVLLGNSTTAGSRQLNGLMDDARIYNRALSAAEVLALYQSYDPGVVVSDLQKGLVGHWKLNGNARDYTSNANDGTVTGATLTTDRKGQSNKAYTFAGGTDKISAGAGTSLNITSKITLALWLKPDGANSTDSDEGLAGKTLTEYAMTYDDRASPHGDVNFYINSGGQRANTGAGGAPNSVWTHIVGTYDGTTISIYKNGALSDTTLLTASINPALTTAFQIGKSGTSGSFLGDIDDVRVYNRVLSTTEITALYESYDPGVVVSDLQKGLVGEWKMDGNARDYTPNSNNGTVTGATLTTDRKGQSNRAYNFDGTTNTHEISIADSPSLDAAGAMTISAWVKITSFTNNIECVASRIGGTGGWSLEKNSGTNTLRFYVNIPGDTNGPQTGTLSTGTWYHIVGTNNGTTSIMYTNGVAGNTLTIAGPGTLTAKTMKIGMQNNASDASRRFDGVIDDVRLYNRALSAAEVLALYQSY